MHYDLIVIKLDFNLFTFQKYNKILSTEIENVPKILNY